jgi:hypothetical protein
MCVVNTTILIVGAKERGEALPLPAAVKAAAVQLLAVAEYRYELPAIFRQVHLIPGKPNLGHGMATLDNCLCSISRLTYHGMVMLRWTSVLLA